MTGPDTNEDRSARKARTETDTAQPGFVFRPAQTPLRGHPTESRLIKVLAQLPFHNDGRLLVALKEGTHGRFVDLRLWVVRFGRLVPGKGIAVHEANVQGIARAFEEASHLLAGKA